MKKIRIIDILVSFFIILACSVALVLTIRSKGQWYGWATGILGWSAFFLVQCSLYKR